MNRYRVPGTTVFKMEVDKLGGTKSTEFIGDEGYIFYDPSIGDLRISDDMTPGGLPLLQVLMNAPTGNTIVINGNTTPLPGSNTEVYKFTMFEAQGVINYGNVKSGFQSGDHFGWVKLDGRAVSSLTTTQQTIATQFGWTTNIPDASGRVAKMSGEAVGTIGGSDVYNILQTNLPKVNLSGFATIPNYTRVDVIAAINNDNPDVFGNINGDLAATVSGIQLNPGTFTPFTVVNKYLALNTFVYLGL